MRNKDKDKKTNQSSPKPDDSGAPQTSSIALALQKLTKEKEMKQADEKMSAQAPKVPCKSCFKETSGPNKRCFGHGGGGGGGDSSTSTAKASPSGDNPSDKQGINLANMENLIGEFDLMGEGQELESPAAETTFDLKIIAELTEKEILLVTNDRESKTLTIQFKPELLLTDKQREQAQLQVNKYIQAIVMEFNDFKTEYNLEHPDHQLADDCIKIIKDKDNFVYLSITLPTPALYDAFLLRLANNLVPTPEPKAQDQNEARQRPMPTPFSMEPKLSGNKNKKLDKEEAKNEHTAPQKIEPETSPEVEPETDPETPSTLKPFSMTPKPW
jgi:hypothetical protein